MTYLLPFNRSSRYEPKKCTGESFKKRRLPTLFLIIAAFAAGELVPETSWAQKAPPEKLEIYLLMGQSNMSGRGDLNDLPQELNTSTRDIWLYGNDGAWRPAVEPIDTSLGQIDLISSDGDKPGVGPGLAFARVMQVSTSAQIGLVPCAKGGTSLSRWMPNTDRNRLYGSCLARAKEAASQGRIAGILWYQGETDAETANAAEAWQGRMVTLIKTLRFDLSDHCLAWVIVGLSDRPDPSKWRRSTEGWSTVQTAQANLPSVVSHVGFVSAVGLQRNSDDIHLSTAGQLELGIKLAHAMRSLEKQQCNS